MLYTSVVQVKRCVQKKRIKIKIDGVELLQKVSG